MTVQAQEAHVSVAPGDVNRVCPACHTGQATGHDNDPRHVVLGSTSELQEARLPDGQSVPVRVPVDEAYHLDCHAAMGCDHCAEVLDAHDGSVKGKAHPETGLPSVPEELLDLEPDEFVKGESGVLTRVADKQTARANREDAESSAGYEVVDADEAAALHAAHAAGQATGTES